jgi:hypothetical protein
MKTVWAEASACSLSKAAAPSREKPTGCSWNWEERWRLLLPDNMTYLMFHVFHFVNKQRSDWVYNVLDLIHRKKLLY